MGESPHTRQSALLYQVIDLPLRPLSQTPLNLRPGSAPRICRFRRDLNARANE